MSVLETVKTMSTNARKSKSATSAFLVTLYSEISNIGLNDGKRLTTDEEAFRVIKKFLDGARLNLSYKPDDAMIKQEIEILESLMPSQMSEAELTAFINGVILSGKTQVGVIMAELKKSHAGKYDGALASKITKSLLSV